MIDDLEKSLFFGVQHTLAQEFELFGPGLMTGEICSVRVKPLPEDSGIIFVVDGEEVKLSQNTTYPGFHNLTLRGPTYDVIYIEHLLSVFFAFGVDNALVEIEGREIPFFDGSSLIFSERMLQVGLRPQNSLRKYAVVVEPLEISDGSGYIKVEPYHEFFVHAVYQRKATREEFVFTEKTFYPDEIAPARTFIYENELKNAISMGLFKGGDIDSAIVFSDETDAPLNTELRFQNERVRHKILDFLGDIYSLGIRILGKFYIVNQSHKLVREFLKNLKYEVL